MAAAIGNLLQVTDFQTYLGQEVLNIYHYRVTSITGLAGTYLTDIANWFNDNVIEQLVTNQLELLVHTHVEARNLTNNIDIADLGLDRPGDLNEAGGNPLPSYVSLGFKLVRESLVTRNGYKRIAGLSDERVDGNVYTFSGTEEADIEAALAADIVLGLVTIAEPIIWGSPREVPPVVSYTYASIGSAQFTQLGTQNTRKAGRGS